MEKIKKEHIMQRQEININELFSIIGAKETEIIFLRSRVAELENQINDAKQEKKDIE
jgi:hypothetical protein